MFSWLWRMRKSSVSGSGKDRETNHDTATLASGDGASGFSGAGAEAHPHLGTKVRIAFANGQRTWEEEADLIAVLGTLLRDNGHKIAPHDDGLLHVDTGLVLSPNLCGFQPLDRGGVSTASIVQATHPAFAGVRPFEYQHWTGDNLVDSLKTGFDHWRQGDLPVLLDALRDKPATCMAMEMALPATADAPARNRRAVLGPIAHFRQHGPTDVVEHGPDGQEHSFCPCCMLTRSFDAFKPLVEGNGLYAIRLYAMRDENGRGQADCRVNGDDYELGKAALRRYASSWPEAGFEFRKQYVILQTLASRRLPEGRGT